MTASTSISGYSLYGKTPDYVLARGLTRRASPADRLMQNFKSDAHFPVAGVYFAARVTTGRVWRARPEVVGQGEPLLDIAIEKIQQEAQWRTIKRVRAHAHQSCKVKRLST
jgi:hypothetical protein